jgi:hypothetical protein
VSSCLTSLAPSQKVFPIGFADKKKISISIMQVKGYKEIIIAQVFDWSEIATECILTNEISL